MTKDASFYYYTITHLYQICEKKNYLILAELGFNSPSYIQDELCYEVCLETVDHTYNKTEDIWQAVRRIIQRSANPVTELSIRRID